MENAAAHAEVEALIDNHSQASDAVIFTIVSMMRAAKKDGLNTSQRASTVWLWQKSLTQLTSGYPACRQILTPSHLPGMVETSAFQ